MNETGADANETTAPAATGPGFSEPPAARTPSAPRIPAAALSDRNARARAKGLPGIMIQGGEDPAPEAGRAEERRYLRLLIVMVAVIVLSGFVLGFVGLIVGGPAPS